MIEFHSSHYRKLRIDRVNRLCAITHGSTNLYDRVRDPRELGGVQQAWACKDETTNAIEVADAIIPPVSLVRIATVKERECLSKECYSTLNQMGISRDRDVRDLKLLRESVPEIYYIYIYIYTCPCLPRRLCYFSGKRRVCYISSYIGLLYTCWFSDVCLKYGRSIQVYTRMYST